MGRQWVERTAMVIPRNRKRPGTSFEERLLKFAEEARAAAKLIAASPEQEQLLRKAVKAKALARPPTGAGRRDVRSRE
jgi:hypothetical protein